MEVWKSMKIDLIKVLSVILVCLFIMAIVLGGQYLWITEITKNSNNIDIQSLIGFYSSLFTAIAVVIGIAALIGWNWIKDVINKNEKESNKKIEELKEKWSEKEKSLNKKIEESDEKLKEFNEYINRFMEVEDKVNYLGRRPKWAKWARKKFDSDDNKTISFKIEYNADEKEVVRKIRARLTDDFVECGWLELIYAKEIMDDPKIEQKYQKTFKILNNIIDQDMVENNETSLEGVVYHLLGQLFWEYYTDSQKNFYNKSGSKVIDFENWKKQEIEDIRTDDKNVKILIYQCLEISKKYYNKALDIRKQRKEKRDETLANLALVLIELVKIDEEKKDDYLKNAKGYLEQVVRIKDTFNTYWDLARLYYYLNKEEEIKIIKDYLFKAIDKVRTIQQKEDFLDGIEDEFDETNFPGEKKLIEELKEKLDRKEYLK